MDRDADLLLDGDYLDNLEDTISVVDQTIFDNSITNSDDVLNIDVEDTTATEEKKSSNHSKYLQAAQSQPLLDFKQECELGATLVESRYEMTQMLAKIPCCHALLIKAWDEAIYGNRQSSDVLQWPLGTPTHEEESDSTSTAKTDSEADSNGPRYQMNQLEQMYLKWMQHAESESGFKSLDNEQVELFITIAPAFAMLCEMRQLVESLYKKLILVHNGSADEVSEHHICKKLGHGIGEFSSLLSVTRQAENRFQKARRIMFESNIRLVFHNAGKFLNNGVSFDDLVQEGSIGLLRAIEKYDYHLGFKFSTYATTWIWQAVTRSIANQRRTIRVPAHVHDKMLKIRNMTTTLTQRLGHEPSVEELAAESKLSVEIVQRAISASKESLSLDAPIKSGEYATYADLTPDENSADVNTQIYLEEMGDRLEELLDKLPPREAMILRLRHGLGGSDSYTLEEIGEILSITRERTRQLQNRALETLRKRARFMMQ